MRIVRYRKDKNELQLAAVTDDSKVYPLPFQSLLDIVQEAKEKGVTPVEVTKAVIQDTFPQETNLDELEIVTPIDAPEVWAAGVTYFRSMEARNYESTGGKKQATTYYDKVYEAARPELFFKSTKERTIGPDQPIYLRTDSNWQIPEPEFGLVVDSDGTIIGYTIGNDMSSRDIEGENPLYLTQAKIWKNSCSIGPAIRLAETVQDPYNLDMSCRIYRDGECVFEGTANTNQLKRKYDELVSYLLQDNVVFAGTVLLTGTSIVPPNEFTLQDGDEIEIEVEGIGVLRNRTVQREVTVKN